jgi:hypothetical protein
VAVFIKSGLKPDEKQIRENDCQPVFQKLIMNMLIFGEIINLPETHKNFIPI